MKPLSVQEWNQFGSQFQNLNNAIIPEQCTKGASHGGIFSGNRQSEATAIGETYRSKCFSLVVELVSAIFEISEDNLLAQTRGVAPICQARQICMYLLHTSLSISYPDIGRMFRRDRTTISHACMIVEDLRDDEGIDQNLTRLESILAITRSLRGDAELMVLGEVQ